MNALNVITPYKHNGLWVFDDHAVGLRQEPFVAGADTMIDVLTKGMPNAQEGFNLIFTASKFPTAQICLHWIEEANGGNVYYSASLHMEAWLCPALLKYFETAPKKIYIEVRPCTH